MPLKRKKESKKEKRQCMWITEAVTHIHCLIIITIILRFNLPETVNAIQAWSTHNA
jgi:hypothetical protein